MTIRCIIFDMGKVLVHFSHDGMFAAMGEVCGATGHQIREWLWDSGLQARFERGEIDAGAVRDELERRAGCEIDEEALMQAASAASHPIPAKTALVNSFSCSCCIFMCSVVRSRISATVLVWYSCEATM